MDAVRSCRVWEEPDGEMQPVLQSSIVHHELWVKLLIMLETAAA